MIKLINIFFAIHLQGAADADRGNHTNKGNPTPGRPTGNPQKKHTKNPNASPNASG